MRTLLNPHDWLAQHPRLILALLSLGYVAVGTLEVM